MVTSMDTQTAPTLRVVRCDDDPARGTPPTAGTAAQEEYWARVQALRADLDRLLAAN